MKLSNILTLITLVPELFTVVDSAVKSVEESLGNVPGVSGSQKLDAAKTKINAFLESAGHDISALQSVGSLITPIINAAVAVFNSVGLFKKTQQAATVATPPTNPTLPAGTFS